MSTKRSTYGARFEFCRNITGLSQAEASRRMGIGQSSLSNYEKDISLPGTKTVIKMADLYGVSTDFLLSRSDETDLAGGGHISL